MKSSPITQAQKEEIFTLRSERGWSLKRISEKVGISTGAISWHCLMAGVERYDGRLGYPPSTTGRNYTRNGRQVRAYTPEEDQKIIDLDRQGLSYCAIAKKIGRRHNSVQGRMATLARQEERAMAQA